MPMSDVMLESIDLPEPSVFKRTLFEPSGIRDFRRLIPDHELLIKPQRNRVVRHAAVSLVEVHDVHLWANNRIQCFYSAYDGVYKSLTMEHTPINWDMAVGTPVREIPGTTVLFPHLDPHNYYHWLIDTMPCFGILERAEIELSSIDQIYIHRMVNQFQWTMLDMMGVDAHKVLYNRKGESHYLFERLLVPDFRLHGHGWPHPWLVSYLKHRFAPLERSTQAVDSQLVPLKLYIARGKGMRAIANEGALIDKLESLDYEILHPQDVSFMDQVNTLSRVDFVLSSHGAGLANIVFCKPGLKMIEFGGHYITEHFRNIAEYCDADYRAIAAGVDNAGNRLPISDAESSRCKNFIADIDEIIRQAENFYRQSV